MASREAVARIIDHTLLKPESTPEAVQALIEEAAKLGTYSVCISPSQLPVQVPEGLHVATVVGFPSGAVKASIKAAEAKQAVADGAEEIDMVINLAFALDGRFDELQAEIQAVRNATQGAVLKVILETAALPDETITQTCLAAEAAGADFVKTSTGFHPAGGASLHAVALMQAAVGGRLGIKASGGIRTATDALAMIDAGASRLGLSSSAKVLEELS